MKLISPKSSFAYGSNWQGIFSVFSPLFSPPCVPCPVEEDRDGTARWAGGATRGWRGDNPVRGRADPAQAVTNFPVLWHFRGPALPQGSFSVHPAIATQLLAAFPTDSAEGIEGTVVRFLMLKCPFGTKSSHFTAVQHCLNRALWQTVAPFSFLTTILVWMSWSQVSLGICILQPPLYDYTVTTWGTNLYSLSITVLFALPFLSHTWSQLNIHYWKRECSRSLASSWQYLLQAVSMCLSYKISY